MKEILLVDDDPDCQGLIKNLLENEGMKVHCAARGAEALRKMKEMSFHLMITDLNRWQWQWMVAEQVEMVLDMDHHDYR